MIHCALKHRLYCIELSNTNISLLHFSICISVLMDLHKLVYALSLQMEPTYIYFISFSLGSICLCVCLFIECVIQFIDFVVVSVSETMYDYSYY